MKTTDASQLRQLLRFILNGVVATLAHYATLRLLLDGVGLSSAGLANGLAACVGVAASFLGSRWFVFRSTSEDWRVQLSRFIVLYGALAIAHALILWLWSDWLHRDVTIGFVIALTVQTVASYFGNKRLVFRQTADETLERDSGR